MRTIARIGPVLLAAAVAVLVPAAPVARDAAGDGPAGVTRIQGRALEGRRTPVVGASVTVRDQDGRGILYLTSTDAKGYVRALDLPDGTYAVTFRKPGYGAVVKADVEVRSPLRPVLEVRMAPGDEESMAQPPRASGSVRVTGRAVDVLGRPVPDVRVRLVRDDGSRDPRRARSGTLGGFEVGGLAGGRWRAEIVGVGFLPIRSPIDADRDLDVVVRLVPQPADYEATALDLMPPETPIPPPAFVATGGASEPAEATVE